MMVRDTNDRSTFKITVEKSSLQGEIENLETGKKWTFHSLFELIIIFAEWMDTHNSPIPGRRLRTWESDEGSLEKQIAQILNSMQCMNPFKERERSIPLVQESRETFQ